MHPRACAAVAKHTYAQNPRHAWNHSKRRCIQRPIQLVEPKVLAEPCMTTKTLQWLGSRHTRDLVLLPRTATHNTGNPHKGSDSCSAATRCIMYFIVRSNVNLTSGTRTFPAQQQQLQQKTAGTVVICRKMDGTHEADWLLLRRNSWSPTMTSHVR